MEVLNKNMSNNSKIGKGLDSIETGVEKWRGKMSGEIDKANVGRQEE